MIGLASNSIPHLSDVVHHMVFTSLSGYQLLCRAPWAVSTSMYNARVATEVDSVGRTMTIRSLTRDPVDCMACLVQHGRR